MKSHSELVHGTIESITPKGAGVFYLDKCPVYVAGTAPGDRVSVVIIKSAKSYKIGKLVDFSIAGPRRRHSPCNKSGKCGGCGLIHLFPDYQRELKTEWIHSSLGSFTATIRSIQFGDDVGTRHRLHLSKSADHAHYFGLNRLHSQFVEPLHGCPMASDAIANSWAEWESWGKSHDVDHIIVRGNSEGHWVATGFRSDRDPVHFGGISTLTETINGIQYEWPVDSFFQANIPLVSHLTQTVVDLLNPQVDEIGVDLCCGVGLFGLPMARRSRSVLGVETTPQSVQFANSNAVKNQITNFSAICQSIDALSITDFDATFAVVDPPRTGLGTRLCDRLNSSSLERVVYVSCNPDTMARDLDTLTQAFEVREIIPYDMFPNTIHCEVVALLHRK